MNGYVKKVSRTLIFGLVIFIVCIIIYLAYPKYQIISNSGTIWKLNKVTGQVTRETSPHLGQIDLDKILGE